MEIHTHRFDMTDPFAQVKQRVAQAETALRQMPPAQRRALVTAMQQSAITPAPRSIDGPVATTSVAVRDWDGGRNVLPRYGATPLRIVRTARRRIPQSWLLRGLRWADRLEARLQRWWRRQQRATRREVLIWQRQQLHRPRRR